MAPERALPRRQSLVSFSSRSPVLTWRPTMAATSATRPGARRRGSSPSSSPRSRAASGPCGPGRPARRPRRRPGRAGGRRPGRGRPGRPWGSRGPTRPASGRATSTSRGWPLSSKKTVRLPSAWGSPTARSLTIRVLPCSISTLISSPGSGPKKNSGSAASSVGVRPLVRREVGEDARVEQVAEGLASGLASRPSRAAAFSRAASRSAGGRSAPGRSVLAGAALEHALLERRGEAAGGLAEPPLEELDHALGERQLAVGVEHVARASGCWRPGTGPCRRRPWTTASP